MIFTQAPIHTIILPVVAAIGLGLMRSSQAAPAHNAPAPKDTVQFGLHCPVGLKYVRHEVSTFSYPNGTKEDVVTNTRFELLKIVNGNSSWRHVENSEFQYVRGGKTYTKSIHKDVSVIWVEDSVGNVLNIQGKNTRPDELYQFIPRTRIHVGHRWALFSTENRVHVPVYYEFTGFQTQKKRTYAIIRSKMDTAACHTAITDLIDLRTGLNVEHRQTGTLCRPGKPLLTYQSKWVTQDVAGHPFLP